MGKGSLPDDMRKLETYKNTIESNYPPEKYTMLREALDYCLKMIQLEIDCRYSRRRLGEYDEMNKEEGE